MATSADFQSLHDSLKPKHSLFPKFFIYKGPAYRRPGCTLSQTDISPTLRPSLLCLARTSDQPSPSCPPPPLCSVMVSILKNKLWQAASPIPQTQLTTLLPAALRTLCQRTGLAWELPMAWSPPHSSCTCLDNQSTSSCACSFACACHAKWKLKPLPPLGITHPLFRPSLNPHASSPGEDRLLPPLGCPSLWHVSPHIHDSHSHCALLYRSCPHCLHSALLLPQ
jgi:hypothetical protein